MKRVLFVCIGNSCRSQIAEGFARAYGADVMIAASAGLSPAMTVASDTVKAMAGKDIDIKDHFPKSYQHLAKIPFDIVVNMSGHTIKDPTARAWTVRDPIGLPFKVYIEVRDEIERLVMNLILELRKQPAA